MRQRCVYLDSTTWIDNGYNSNRKKGDGRNDKLKVYKKLHINKSHKNSVTIIYTHGTIFQSTWLLLFVT